MENMQYEEAKKLLNTSHLSLTVLKPSISTTSSHRSLVQSQHDREHDEKTAESDSLVSAEGHVSVSGVSGGISSLHTRSPSAPVQMIGSELMLFGGGTSLPHVKSTSVIKMSDDDIKKVLLDLTEEQRRREHLEMIDESKPQRSPPFITNIRRNGVAGGDFAHPHRPYRPRSTNSITNSINSSGSTGGRCDLMSSPLQTMTRGSDPLALDPMRTIGQASSATTSNTSVNSMSHQKRWGKQGGRYTPRTYDHHTWAGPPPKLVSEANFNPNHSYGHELSSLYTKISSQHSTDFSDRHTPSHHSTTSKQGSYRSVTGHYTNTSSHDSLNSDLSENPSGVGVGGGVFIVEPVAEEAEVPFNGSFSDSIKSSVHGRRSTGSSVAPSAVRDAGSPTSSKKNAKRNTHKTSSRYI